MLSDKIVYRATEEKMFHLFRLPSTVAILAIFSSFVYMVDLNFHNSLSSLSVATWGLVVDRLTGAVDTQNEEDIRAELTLKCLESTPWQNHLLE